MSRGLLIHNTKAGSLNRALLSKIVAALGEVIPYDIGELGSANDALPYARSHHCEWIAVAGGDGTVESVASAILGTQIPFGIVPVGTYNNFARSLDLPVDPIEACKVIVAGNTQAVDVGCANGRPFFECLGSGLDAALYPLSEEIKSGRVHRIIDFLHRAFRFPRQTFSLTLDRPVNAALVHASKNESRHLYHLLTRDRRSRITLPALMVTVSNGPFFGMNFAVAPHERMDDGLLTVSIFSRYSKLQLWWHFASIAFGRREYSPKSIAFRVGKLQLGGARKLPVHLDGNPQEDLWPVDIECRKGALRVFKKSKT
jgi:diacylglycerol kinase family enzyme